MVTRLLHLPEVPKPPDAADALALAICHLSAGRFRAAAGAGGAMRTFDGSSPPPRCPAWPGPSPPPPNGRHPEGRLEAAPGSVRCMIGSLRGTILDRAIGGEVLVEVGGVGYRVAVPSGAFAALEPGGPAFLFTHLVVREDALSLYGFPDREQRDTFEALMSATGVGPKLALAILSAHSPSALRRAVIEGDLDALTLVPGRREAHRPAAHDRAGGQARHHRPRPRRRRRGRPERPGRDAGRPRGPRLRRRGGALRARQPCPTTGPSRCC